VIADRFAVGPDRAERPLAFAIDVGSSSIRAGLYDRRGRLVRGCATQVLYGWDLDTDGSVRLPLQVLLNLVERALDEVAAAAGQLVQDAVVAGVSCFFHSILGLDSAGRALTPVLSWADTTSAHEAAALRATIDATHAHACTGAPIHAGYWPARIIRLRQEQPAIRRWAGFPELLAEALTGRAVVSRSMASGTGLLDRASGAWWPEIFDRLSVEPGQLSPIVDDEEPIGLLAGTAAQRWPTLAHLTWFGAWGDGACGNVGLGAIGPGHAALMIGTSGAIRTILPDPAPPIPPGLFAYRLRRGALLGGQLSEGGGTVASIATLLGRSPASLERAAAGLLPDAHGLTILPYIYGERGLGYHDGARGILAGLASGTDAAQVYRAVLEAVAYRFAALDERLSAVLSASPAIIASGGAIARSQLWAQIIADALGRDIEVASSVEASSRGAALLALRGAELLDDLQAAPGLSTRTIRSDPDRAARYREGRTRQEELYAALLG
jgi:gluconokinase